MADITVTAANVRPLPGCQVQKLQAGGSGSVGDSVYMAADGDVEEADASAAGTAVMIGIVLSAPGGKTTFVAGDYLDVAVYGPVTGFSGMTPATGLYQSDTLAKLADAAGSTSRYAGWAMTATEVFLAPGQVAAATEVDLEGDNMKVVANANVLGGVPVLHRVLIASGANANVDVVLTEKTRVIDFWVVLKGAGTAGCLVTLKNGATAISDAMDVAAGGDRDIFRAGEIDDAQHEISAGGTLRVTKASTGADFPGCEAYVLGVKVA